MFSINTRVFSTLALTALATTFMASCGNDDGDVDPGLGYNVPSAYTFENVDYSGQTTRIMMLDEMKTVMGTGTSSQVQAEVLKDMFANRNNPFTNPDLNAATSKQLQDKTFYLDTTDFINYMDTLALASQSFSVAATPGQAGVITSSDGTKKYLVSANGFEYAQIIQKGLMGATFYYQAVDGYLSDEKIGNTVDNTTVTPGKGTTMEHHWDEAFGYFGVPVDFPANTAGTKYWGSYTNSVGSKINADDNLMNAFLTGRAAISNKDMATKDAQIVIIKNEWEKVAAATAIHYLNAAKTSWSNEAVKHHALSEAVGFVMALKYNSDKMISQTQIDSVLNTLNFPNGSLYEVTVADVDAAITELNSVYNFANPASL